MIGAVNAVTGDVPRRRGNPAGGLSAGTDHHDGASPWLRRRPP